MSTAPHFDIDMAAFWRDPYPTLAQLRKDAPIAFVPQLGGTVFAARDDIFLCEKNIEVFSSHQPQGLMNKLMGQNMMRKDGDAHMAERKAIFPSVSPKTVKAHWTAQFQAHADRILDALDPGRDDRFLHRFRHAVFGRMPEVDHRPDQHALSGHGRLVAGHDRRDRELYRRAVGRGALPSRHRRDRCCDRRHGCRSSPRRRTRACSA